MDKKDNAIVSRAWTRGEIRKAIEGHGKIADEEGIRMIIECLKEDVTSGSFLDSIIERNAFKLCQSSEPEASLFRLGIAFPSCERCELFDTYHSYCEHYGTFENPNDNAPGDCEYHYVIDNRATLSYEYEKFPVPFIRIDNKHDYPYPDPLEVVQALRKDPHWAEELDKICARIDDAEDPAKWTWV